MIRGISKVYLTPFPLSSTSLQAAVLAAEAIACSRSKSSSQWGGRHTAKVGAPGAAVDFRRSDVPPGALSFHKAHSPAPQTFPP